VNRSGSARTPAISRYKPVTAGEGVVYVMYLKDLSDWTNNGGVMNIYMR
jgi:hypothetical protein